MTDTTRPRRLIPLTRVTAAAAGLFLLAAGLSAWFYAARSAPTLTTALNRPVAPGRAPELPDGTTQGVKRIRAFNGHDVDIMLEGPGHATVRSALSPHTSVFYDVAPSATGWVRYERGDKGHLDIHLHDRKQIVR